MEKVSATPSPYAPFTHAVLVFGWTPMGRLGTPADIGNAVSLLCMDEASFITGQIIHVDGGGSLMDAVFPPEIQRG